MILVSHLTLTNVPKLVDNSSLSLVNCMNGGVVLVGLLEVYGSRLKELYYE